MGYQPVYAKSLQALERRENRHSNYQSIKTIISQKQGNPSPNNAKGKLFPARKRCLKKENDTTCHNFFQRCYISFRPQSLCREACEDLIFNVCKREARLLASLIKWSIFTRYGFRVMNCTEMPFRNESPNCYYPDEMRGQWRRLVPCSAICYTDARGIRKGRNPNVTLVYQMSENTLPRYHAGTWGRGLQR